MGRSRNSVENGAGPVPAALPPEAEGLDPDALLAFALGGYEGKTKQNSFALIELAAKRGCAAAMLQAGLRCGEGIGTKRDESAAFAWFARAADAGNADARHQLALCWLLGEGTEKSPDRFREEVERAAEEGSARACECLAGDFRYGQRGRAQDPVSAFEHYSKAAERGSVQARYQIGTMYRRLEIPACRWTAPDEESAAWCEAAFGILDSGGADGDGARAVELLERSAEIGNPKALNALGLLFLDGKADPASASRGFDRLLAAYRAGYPAALNNLDIKMRQYPEVRFEGREEALAAIRDSLRRGKAWLEDALRLGAAEARRDLMEMAEEAGDQFRLPDASGTTDDPILRGASLCSLARLKKLDPKAWRRLKNYSEDALVYYWADDAALVGDFDFDARHAEDFLGFVFGKNLTVEGDVVQTETDSGPLLLVMGSLRARHIDKGGSIFEIRGDCEVRGMIYGRHNDGLLQVGGTVSAALIVADDHPFKFGRIDPARSEPPMDIYGARLGTIFVKAVVGKGDRFDSQQARRLLDEGKPILKAHG